jgi:hypothetical protein
MAGLGRKYTAGDVETEQRDFEDLPAGILQFEIEATEIVETGPESNRTGNGMKYTANVLAPEEVKGRKFFGFINLENKSDIAQKIGQQEFACLRRACGIDEIEDTEELHFISYTVKLGLGKPSKAKNADGTPTYPARMEVKRYYFADEGNVPAPCLDATQPARAPAAANDNRASANDNKPAATQQKAAPASAPGGKARPWGKSR